MLFNVEHRSINHQKGLESRRRHSMLLRQLADKYDLKQLAQLSPEVALREVRPLLAYLASKQAVLSRSGHDQFTPHESNQPYVALSCTESDPSYALQLFVWPAHSTTQIHDHSCWGAFCAVTGALREDRFERLDDGVRPNYAHIRTSWQRMWQHEDGVSTLLPYAGGIHRVSNPSHRPILSMHLYGPPAEIDGRDYDPRRDYVCDRFADDALV